MVQMGIIVHTLRQSFLEGTHVACPPRNSCMKSRKRELARVLMLGRFRSLWDFISSLPVTALITPLASSYWSHSWNAFQTSLIPISLLLRTIFGDQQWRWLCLSSSPRLQWQQHSFVLGDGPWRSNHRHDQDPSDRKPSILQKHKQPAQDWHV